MLKLAPEPARERSLRLTSNLAGLELDLPEPLAKPAGLSLPASVDTQWPPSGGVQVRVALGSVLRGALTLDSDASGPRLARAAVAFGSAEPAYSDTQIVNVGGTIEKLDLAGWFKLRAPAKSAKPLANYLSSANLEVAQLDYLGLSFLDVALALTENDGGWRIARRWAERGRHDFPAPELEDPAEPWNLRIRAPQVRRCGHATGAARRSGRSERPPRIRAVSRRSISTRRS